MIPSIESIVEMLIAGECTAQQAIGWISQHMENADLRDQFAAQALPALINACLNDDAVMAYTDHCSTKAYQMADAMLKARQS